MLDHRAIKSGKVKLDSLQVAVCGAAPVPWSLKEGFEAAGARALNEAYGMSEISGGTHSNPMLGENRRDSVGLPLPDVECAIISLEDGVTEMPIGEVGEIVVHSPHMLREYLGMPEETDTLLRRREDGKLWVYTGDVGYMDEDGYFYITARNKNMVLIGGFNVYPVQIEQALRSHPAVADVRVVGVPHPKRVGEETLKAWVVLNPGVTITSGELVGYCKEYLAGYEVPRRFEFVEELPPITINRGIYYELVRTEPAPIEEDQHEAIPA